MALPKLSIEETKLLQTFLQAFEEALPNSWARGEGVIRQPAVALWVGMRAMDVEMNAEMDRLREQVRRLSS